LGQVFVDSEGSAFHVGLFNDTNFLVKFRLEPFPDLGFGEFRELDDVLPYRALGTHEKIRVVRGNLHSTDTGSLQSGLIDELARARSRGIREIRTAGKSWGLLSPADGLHFGNAQPGERILGLRVTQVEFRRQHDVSIVSFKMGSPVRVSHFFI
jgi:hypothetical protein